MKPTKIRLTKSIQTMVDEYLLKQRSSIQFSAMKTVPYDQYSKLLTQN